MDAYQIHVLLELHAPALLMALGSVVLALQAIEEMVFNVQMLMRLVAKVSHILY